MVTEAFSIDLADKRIVVNEDEVHLNQQSGAFLAVLVRRRGRLVSQQQLLREVRGPSYHDETNYLRVYVANLRRKLEPARPRRRSRPSRLFRPTARRSS